MECRHVTSGKGSGKSAGRNVKKRRRKNRDKYNDSDENKFFHTKTLPQLEQFLQISGIGGGQVWVKFILEVLICVYKARI